MIINRPGDILLEDDGANFLREDAQMNRVHPD
jgi:hypothetical protein